MTKKGISPILASVLLFAVTVSVVGIFANFAPNLVSTVTEGTQEQAQSQITCEGAGISFEGVSYDSSNNDVAANVRNTGESRLTNVTVAAFGSDGTLIDQTEDKTVYLTNVTDVTLSSVSSQPAFVQAFSGRCGSIEIRQDL
jgi:archaeal flagellin N-terminal-like domain|nr:MAG: archaeal flagellin N-terminal-like domain protein [Candidatus Nanosalinarum sp. J07AB56]